MKKNLLLSRFTSVVLLISIFYFGACSQHNKLETSPELVKSNKEVLQKPTSLENGVQLPAGTKWVYTDQTQSEVEFELPEGYKFLIYDASNNTFQMASRTGGYTCKCDDGKGSCIVIYNQDIGFGCLQGTCTGTCIGKSTSRLNTNITIEGVLYTENDMVDAQSAQKASLTELGKKGIFTLPEFRNEIKRTYDLIYKHQEKVDFDNIPENGKYVFAKTYLYGYEISLVLPKDENLRKIMPNLELREDKPKNCTCSEGTGSCKLEKSGLLGYVVYHCTGCRACTMNF
ncbi:MAG: hypothetical protein OHK0045_21190 [Raineya sp.]